MTGQAVGKTEQQPVFFVVYWPARLSRSRPGQPPPAARGVDGEPCRWELRTTYPVATAGRDVCLTVAGAALALAHRTGGVAIDTYGFPIDHPGDLLPP
jgi:hypothetical protein